MLLLRSHAAESWKDVDAKGMKLFLALLILQGIVVKPQVNMCWCKKDVLATPLFGKVMSWNQFQVLMRCLHFVNNEDQIDKASHPNPRLSKLWPVIEKLNDKFLTIYTPTQDVSVDESPLLYNGQHGWKQDMPLKHVRFGSSFFCMSQAVRVNTSAI